MDAVRSQRELRALVASVRAHVEHAAEGGAAGFPVAASRPPECGAPAAAAPVAAEGGTVSPPILGGGDLFLSPAVRSAASLEELRAEIGDCRRCKLAPHRTHVVFGVGNPHAALMFIGEAPGRDEDLQAEPFVGRAGQLLTEIITKGMKLRRDEVYIANIIKCRPPGNRNPEADEVASCHPFLQRQVELVRPQVIVALGTFATQALLETRTPITRLRGQWHDYHGIRLMPTFHPAYLLRNPHDKALVWQDIKAVMREIGLRPEAR
jgi:uracil-DNA glycosylase family 4